MKQQLLNALFVAWLSTVGVAQATIGVPTTATVGQDITITYSNPNAAGQTITVTIDDGGFPTPTVQTVTIQLDANGEGSVKWRVPNWLSAKFNAMGAHEKLMTIEQPPTAANGT